MGRAYQYYLPIRYITSEGSDIIFSIGLNTAWQRGLSLILSMDDIISTRSESG